MAMFWHPMSARLTDYDYNLPRELIAAATAGTA